MTDLDEIQSIRRIESCRKLQRSLAEKVAATGVSLEEVAIASAYSALDIAMTLKGDGFIGLEWLRTALDIHEASMMAERSTRQ